MGTNESQNSSGIKVDRVWQSIHYCVYGSHGDYTFHASVCKSGTCCTGIDDGRICVLNIHRIGKSGEQFGFKALFDFDYGWNAYSDNKADVSAYKSIRSFLENLPTKSKKRMMAMCSG